MVYYYHKFNAANKFGQHPTKSKILSSFLSLNQLINGTSKKEASAFYNNHKHLDSLQRDFLQYHYMSNLLHNFSTQGYFNSKVRLHLKKYSEFFHMYF